MTAKTITAPLSAELADRLLDLLSTDDLFRERFQQDHLAALRSIGYESPPLGLMTACGTLPLSQPEPFGDCKVTDLAPKESIAGARKEIRAMLLRGLDQTTPQLDVGNPGLRHIRK